MAGEVGGIVASVPNIVAVYDGSVVGTSHIESNDGVCYKGMCSKGIGREPC